jgi:inner membrane transporter RhtA
LGLLHPAERSDRPASAGYQRPSFRQHGRSRRVGTSGNRGGAGTKLLDPTVLLLGPAIGLLSSVIPYSFELIALRRIPPRVFSILMSLEPAAAAVAAMILLGEFLSSVQWLAMACVMIASIGATRTSGTLDQPAPD